MDAEKEREYREEAERLRQLPRAEQRAVVELIGSPARDPKVSKANREEARRRARALARLLKLTPRKKRKE
jgi:hypothetical protein